LPLRLGLALDRVLAGRLKRIGFHDLTSGLVELVISSAIQRPRPEVTRFL
jgi:hypothetical protein